MQRVVPSSALVRHTLPSCAAEQTILRLSEGRPARTVVQLWIAEAAKCQNAGNLFFYSLLHFFSVRNVSHGVVKATSPLSPPMCVNRNTKSGSLQGG
jgi:hypothetical protein